MPSWLDIFRSDGTPRDVTGHHPLDLGTTSSAWLVESESVDIFAVPLVDGKPDGARSHLFRAGPGQLLMGLGEITRGTLTLVAVGLPGTRLLELAPARLREKADNDEMVRGLAGLLDGWAEGLTTGAARGSMPQRPSLLEPELTTYLEHGGTVTPGKGTLWVRHVEGESRFFGKPEVTLVKSEVLFPLSSRGWLAAGPSASIRAESTETLLGQDALWAGLGRFHEAILVCAALNNQEAARDEHERLRRKAAREVRLVETTLSQLATVSQQADGEVENQSTVPVDNPLLAACRLVGERLGVTMLAPLRAGEKKKSSDPVSAIARASRVRIRRVALAAGWWNQDNGPLLAFKKKDEGGRMKDESHQQGTSDSSFSSPVALLPASSSSYELVNPVAKTRTLVTPAVAAGLGSFGYCFYRPFPRQALTALGLFRFGLIGSLRDWLVVVVLGLGGGLLGMLTPLAMGWIFDRIIPGQERSQLLLLVLALTASALAIALFQLTQGIAILRVETRMEANVEAGLWDRLLNLPAPFFREYTAGDLAARAGGIAAIRQTLSEVALSSLLSLLFSLVNFVLLFYYSVNLSLLALGLFVVVLAITAFAGFRQVRYERADHTIRGRISGLVLQLVTGISRLRVAAAEDRALAVWAGEFGQQRRLAFRARGIANNLAAFSAALPLIASLLLFGTVAYSVRGGLSLGAFLAFNAAFTQILFAAGMLSSSLTSLLQVVPLYERAQPILATLPEVDLTKADPGDLGGDIEISHVSFRYRKDGPAVLDDVSVHIRAGQFVAFVGPSGAGKSTLFRLLLGFETPASGSIYYDGEDLAGLDLQSVRRQVGVVLQHSRLLPGDILSNIIGSSLLTLEDAWEAARLSGLEKDIEQMPMGMYTIIGEGQSTLSGGQRQRLMIARAIAPRPRILFFDEATSALDNATQARVTTSLARLKATRVVVAHRLSTVMHADCIYVMDRGKVVQSGSYDELMKEGGLFADLVRRQLV
jgi:NHLM bacteriocin system ABC transporter ATP-binding protein